MARNAETVWEFATRNFRVALEIEPEEMDPAESFQFPEDIEAVRSGEVEWFCARVVVYDSEGEELAADSLGGCAYKRVSEFYTAYRGPDPLGRNCSIMRQARGENVCIGHYFPDMVRSAVRDARSAVFARAADYEMLAGRLHDNR